MSRKFKISPVESRNLLVPDVSRMIERYVNREIDRIYDLAENIYRVTIPSIMHEELVRKEAMIERIVNVYIEKYGTNFDTFLNKYGDQIRRYGRGIGESSKTYYGILSSIIEPSVLNVYVYAGISKEVQNLLFGFWADLAREEGYLAQGEDVMDLFDKMANEGKQRTLHQ